MDVVDQSFDGRLSALQADFARSNRTTDFALDNRDDCFHLPALSKQAIQPSSCNQVCPFLAFKSFQVSARPSRWNEVCRFRCLAIETSISHQDPLSFADKWSGATSQTFQKDAIVSRSNALHSAQYELRSGAYHLRTFPKIGHIASCTANAFSVPALLVR